MANHPLLVSLDWDARALAYLRRLGLIEGKQDGTTKMWYVYLEDVLEVLEARNNNKLRGIIDIPGGLGFVGAFTGVFIRLSWGGNGWNVLDRLWIDFG